MNGASRLRGGNLLAAALGVAALGVVAAAVALVGSGDPAGLDPAGLDPVDETSTTEAEDPADPDTAADEPTDEHLDPEPSVADHDTADETETSHGDDEVPVDVERGTLVVAHVGDVNLDPAQLSSAARDDPSVVWEGARETFAEADLVLVNLECAATEGGAPLDKSFVFRCGSDALPAMRDAGVHVANLANNHTGDYGVVGMLDSLRNVEAAGMVGVGVGEDEEEAYRPRVVEVEGWRVAILGFGGVVPTPDWTAVGPRGGQATGYDPVRMAEAVGVAAADADLVVVTVHWGEEGAFEPRAQDRTKAEAMIAAGADVVFGHHAHRLQPLERVAGAPVFWNLGNFVWPRRSADASRTAVATYTVGQDGATQACLLPFVIDDTGVPRPTGAEPTCD